MSYFPIIDSSYWTSYYTDDDQALREYMEKIYAEAITVNQSFWSEADIDTRFRAGDQTLWNDLYGNLPAFRKRQFNFNRIQRVCNMISGHQRRSRKSMVATPVENSSAHTASQFTKVLYHINNSSNVLETLSEAFDDCLTTGLNLIAPWMDWSDDPINGTIKVDSLPYNTFIVDPYFKKRDLSDCNFIWIRRYYTKEQAISLLPQHADYLSKIQPDEYRDGKFLFTPESYQYGTRNLVPYDEFWYRDMRPSTMLVDTDSGETREWRGTEDDLQQFMRQYPQVSIIRKLKPTVKLGISVRNKVLFNGPNPMGIDRFPFIPVFCYYWPQLPYFPWRIQGICRGLRDAQFLYNRRRVIELDILESTVNSGYIFKEEAPVDPRDLFHSGQGRHIAVKQGSQIADIQRIEPPQVPPSMIQLSELLAKEISEVSGVNEELLGSAQDDKAGILSMLRQGAGLTTLQPIFDQLDASQKLLGEVMVDMVQANWTPGKVRKIIGEEPSQEFFHRSFGKYNVRIEEAMLTTTQRQLQFAQLIELKQMGLPIPVSTLIENSTLADKDNLMKSLQQEEQQQAQMAQQKQQMEMAVLQAQIKDLQSRSMANEGLGLERVSRVQENRALAVQRLSEAKRDEETGALNMIKAVKELQGMDLTNLEALVRIAQSIQGQVSPGGSESQQSAPQEVASAGQAANI